MKQLAHIISVLFLTLPILANADPIRVDYSGTVVSAGGTGMGFKVNDAISGWFEFDSDTLHDSYGDGSNVYTYETTSSQSDATNRYSYSYDHASMYDYSRRGYDQLTLRDGSRRSSGWYYSSTYYYAFHQIILTEYADWFDTHDLLGGGTTVYSSSELPNNAHGTLRDYSYYRGHYCWYRCSRGYRYDNYANFSIDTLRVSSVPEPGTLALLGLGLAGMGMSRRKKKV